MNVHDALKIQTALVKYDERQAKRKYYNAYAMGHYMQALGNAKEYMKEGDTLRQAVCKSFCGKLLDVVLKAVGETPSLKTEQVWYK